jgi:hypothetical protein
MTDEQAFAADVGRTAKKIRHVFGWTRHLVNPSKLLDLFTGRSEHAQNLAVERKLVDASRI